MSKLCPRIKKVSTFIEKNNKVSTELEKQKVVRIVGASSSEFLAIHQLCVYICKYICDHVYMYANLCVKFLVLAC